MSDCPVVGPAERARDLAFREFLEPGALPEGARVAEAEARLGAMIEKELGVPVEDSVAQSVRPGRPRRSTTMWALAATIAVMAGASWIALSTRPRETRVLRGTTPTPAPGAWDARAAIEAGSKDEARLTWQVAPGADSYAVVFLSADLTERARMSGLTEAALVLTPETRPQGFAAGDEALWRVHAYAGADEIGRSPALAITFP